MAITVKKVDYDQLYKTYENCLEEIDRLKKIIKDMEYKIMTIKCPKCGIEIRQYRMNKHKIIEHRKG